MKKIFTTLLAALALTAVAATARAAQKSDTFQTPGGKTVTINHIKHASIHIEFDGMHIYFDPVGNNVEPKTDVTLLPKADIIFITHEHPDHFDRLALPQMWKNTTAVYANAAVNQEVHRGVALSNGDSLEYRGVKLWAVPAYNTTPGRENMHPKGRDNGYIISLDGLRIYVAGDTEDIPEMSAIKDIDIAFLPCNQPYTMTIEQLERAAKTIRPKVLFPYHFSATPIAQVMMRLAGTGIDVRLRDYK